MIRKNNMWNRLFHKDDILKNEAELDDIQTIIGFNKEIMKELEAAKDLLRLMEIHKFAWSHGYRHENIGPCSWGIFRTKSIMDMKPEEVYLGGIYGLFTKDITFWDSHKDDCYGANGWGIDPQTSLYEMIVRQYKNHLKSNFKMIYNDAENDLEKFRSAGYHIKPFQFEIK